MKETEHQSEGVVNALAEQLAAGVQHGTSTFKLALAETRLAASSAGALLGIALGAVVLVLFIWILLVALAGYGLWAWGLTPALSMLSLLALHVAGLVLLALIARKLARDLNFTHTREAFTKGLQTNPTASGNSLQPAESPTGDD